ncbi:hypothetical protein NP493_2167g00001 [Ridgeia piscesae]|uniref:Chitin-binding type-2 domain-containing protein n=1 Tax=Ridgeia piscesae TaxID=27915 RepID=A0AAD9N3Z9_RIDPI|nr:hypothetical protein NP493_2167g00001 [Ridgeia piscesae]
MCGDTCEGKPDGYYPSVNRPRPAYYQCEMGQLYYLSCQPFQEFNPHTRKCQCFEGVCLHGDGWKSSFCRGINWRVLCSHGHPIKYRKCPVYRPYCHCHTHVCVQTCGHVYGPGGCCQ